MSYWIRLSHQMICVASCALLCAFVVENQTLSICFATISITILSICVVFLLVKICQNKDWRIVQNRDCDFFWIGFYLIGSVLLMNLGRNWMSAILGALSVYYVLSVIRTTINSK